MPSTISAGTTAGTAIAITGDTTGNLAFQTNGTTTAMTINTNQSILIGTTNSDVGGSVAGIRMNQTGDMISCIDGSGLLHYQSPVAADRRNTAGDGVMYGMWRAGTYQCGIGATNGSTMTFFTGNNASQTERMRLNSSGTLFIGATSSPNGTQRLVLAANGGDGIEPMLINELRTGNSNENAIRFYRNGSQVGTITTNASSTSYNTSSDYRLKENIAPMTGALAKVQQLKPCTYTWKSDGSDGQGFIAHELQEVVPDCVTGEKDAVDEEGKPIYQGVDTSFLVATLTAAIQELKAELDATKAEVAALKGA